MRPLPHRRIDRAGTVAKKASKPVVAHWGGHVWRLLVLWGLLWIAYSNSFQAGLVFDNSTIIGQDPRIRQATPQSIASILSGGYRDADVAAGLYRPLTTLSFLLNYAVLSDGLRPEGYHWLNFAIHAINVALVYALGIALLGGSTPAFALAAIWGLHPLLTESVTNIVGRADLLSAFGVLSGFLCHLRATKANGRRRLAWFAGVAIAQTVGLFSKENAVVLPGIMLAYDLTWSDRSAWRKRIPAYGALVLPFAGFFYVRGQLHLAMHIPFADNPLVSAGFWTARLTAMKVIGKFLWLFLWPARLSADYSFNAVPLFGWRLSSWKDLEAVIALAVCLGGVLLAVLLAKRGRREWKPLLFFLPFFFVAMTPTSNLIVLIGSIMAERFLYLPSVGLAGCVVAALCVWRPATARAAWAAVGVVCLAFAARTYARNRDWNDELSLWTSTVRVSPDSARAHYNLGKALEPLPGRLPDAIAEYRVSLRLDPEHADVHNNLANALSAIPGQLPEAIAEYREAVRIQPDRSEPHNNLANVLARIPGRLPEAIAEFQAALRIRPDSAEIHYNLANALLNQPDGLAEAIREYREALRIDPNHADAHTNLGNALMRIPGRQPEAIAEYRAALRIAPDSSGTLIALGNALSAAPDGLQEGIASYQAAARIRPNDAEAHYDLGTALLRVPDRLADAIAELQAALRNEPNLVEAHVNLGNALARTPGRSAEAIAEYEAALRIRPDPVVQQMADQLRAERRGR
jgi:protein O-mannosyl-transferase